MNIPTFAFSLAQGKVYDRSAKPLSYDDFYKLGLTASRLGDYSLAAEWLQLAASGPDDSIYKPDVLMELAQINWSVSTFH